MAFDLISPKSDFFTTLLFQVVMGAVEDAMAEEEGILAEEEDTRGVEEDIQAAEEDTREAEVHIFVAAILFLDLAAVVLCMWLTRAVQVGAMVVAGAADGIATKFSSSRSTRHGPEPSVAAEEPSWPHAPSIRKMSASRILRRFFDGPQRAAHPGPKRCRPLSNASIGCCVNDLSCRIGEGWMQCEPATAKADPANC